MTADQPGNYLFPSYDHHCGTTSGNHIFFFFKVFFFLIISTFNYYLFYFILAVLGLRFCARASSSCGKRGPLFIAVRGPLTIAASPVEGHRLQTRRLSSCGSRAQLLRGTWDLPRPGLEPVSLALAGRFSTTEPPGKPWESYFNQKYAIKTLPSHLFHSNPTKYLWPVTPKILRRC